MEHRELNEQELAEFERKLRFAMQHRQAPLGLKQRVLARAREQEQVQHGRGWILRWIAASALLVTGIAGLGGGFAVYRQVEARSLEQKRGAEAREQVMVALRITNKTLGRVGARLAENSR